MRQVKPLGNELSLSVLLHLDKRDFGKAGLQAGQSIWSTFVDTL